MFGFLKAHRKERPSAAVVYDSGLPKNDASSHPSVDKHVTLEGRETIHVRQMHGRILLCASVFILIFAGLGIRLVNVALFDSASSVQKFAAANGVSALTRPDVTDRTGRHLAMAKQTKGAAIEVRDVWNKGETATKLAQVFPRFTDENLLNKLQSKKYIILSNELLSSQEQALMKLGLPGVVFFDNQKRVYPQGKTASHVIGYTVPGRGGVAGIEKYLNDLTGKSENQGVVVASIDLTVQQILEQELAATQEEFSAKAAWGVIMDVTTGEVIALASLPTYNPNDITKTAAESWRNRVMYDRYELGSAFKVLTAAIALEEVVSTPEQKYDVRHPLKIADKAIYDYRPKGGFMSLSQILQYSSNIGIAQVGLQIGAKRQRDYFARLGLMAELETELPEKRSPDLPPQWGPVETATISYGHGIAITPLQLAAAVGAVVNGGYFITPTFIKTDEARDKVQVFSAQTSANLRLMLRRVVTDGTARGAETPGYYVIGKTATADKPSLTGGYAENTRLSSFVGAFPGYAPRYVMLVSFDEPQPTAQTYGFATAGIVAAPAFKRIVARAAPALGIAPVNDDVAFAQFMSSFRNNNMQLAMNAEEVNEVSVEQNPEDLMAKLIAELGP